VVTEDAPSGGGQGAGDGSPAPEGETEITADDLRRIARALGLVEVPDPLMPKVLEHVRAHRTAMRTFDAAGIDLGSVVTAQPFRA
jgi:hypothetical protein